MRAMAQREYGGPEVLRLEELPEPVLRDTDILVAVHATSVNPVDTKVRARATVPRDFPLVLGYDVSGIVVRCGAGVTQWQPGDEIFAAPNLFRPGANAELVALDARSAARKPAALDHAAAAALPLVSQTAWQALHMRARIAPGLGPRGDDGGRGGDCDERGGPRGAVAPDRARERDRLRAQLLTLPGESEKGPSQFLEDPRSRARAAVTRRCC